MGLNEWKPYLVVDYFHASKDCKKTTSDQAKHPDRMEDREGGTVSTLDILGIV